MTPVEQVHALWAAFRAGGPLATLAQAGEDCEWLPPPDLPGADAVRSGSEMRAYLARLAREGVRVEPTLHTCEEVGEHVVAGGRMRIVSSTSLSDSPLFWLYRIRAGRVARVEPYASREAALAAASAR